MPKRIPTHNFTLAHGEQIQNPRNSETNKNDKYNKINETSGRSILSIKSVLFFSLIILWRDRAVQVLDKTVTLL